MQPIKYLKQVKFRSTTKIKYLAFIFVLIFSGINTANAKDVKFVNLPDWTFQNKQIENKLFSHDHENFIGTLSKKRGDVAATLFVFKKDLAELRNKKITASEFILNNLLPKETKRIEHINIKSSNKLQLTTYQYEDIIVYVYTYISTKYVYYLTQDTTKDVQRLDLDATLPELSKLKILD